MLSCVVDSDNSILRLVVMMGMIHDNNMCHTFQHADWKYRHAALMAISASGEGCHKQMEPYLETVMEGVMNYIADPHPRVRYACCNAIGQMSTDFAPVFEKKFHAKVIPGLLLLMNDSANPRVQVGRLKSQNKYIK